MTRDEFTRLLCGYGNASEYVGELGADPDCRITRLYKAEVERDRLWYELMAAFDELVKEES